MLQPVNHRDGDQFIEGTEFIVDLNKADPVPNQFELVGVDGFVGFDHFYHNLHNLFLDEDGRVKVLQQREEILLKEPLPLFGVCNRPNL